MSHSLLFRTICLLALCLNSVEHAFAGMLEDGEDFSNNLASDIAPLLSLFGEQVTTQFMSQSTGWADCILLSMAPIGVVTILVSAIRVGGPRWLKAIVGRVRENMVAAELEIMSSTSEESCELWNGQGVVKCQGSSSIREFICIYPTAAHQAHGTAVNNISQVKTVRIMDINTATRSQGNPAGYFRIRERPSSKALLLGLRASDKDFNTFMDQPKDLSKISSGERDAQDLESGNIWESNPSDYQKSLQNGSTSQSVSPSQNGSSSSEGEASLNGVRLHAKSPAPGEVIVVHNQGHLAPNISLNCQADGHRQRIWVYTTFSMFLQAGVLIYFGFVTEYPTLRFEKDGKPVEPYAMPLAVTGTVLLVAGMLICSDVVNRSTTETVRQVDRSSCGISHIWLQKRKRVSDQLFQSAAIYPSVMSYENTTSERRDSNGPARKKDRVALETLTTIGAFVSVVGIAAQFTGLRGMHWTAAITQLGAVILTVVIRAAVRLHLAPHIKNRGLAPGFELEWFVMSLVSSSRPPWLPDSGQNVLPRKHVSPSTSVSKIRENDRNKGPRKSTRLHFRLKTWNSRFTPGPESTISSEKDSTTSTKQPRNEPELGSGARNESYDEVVSEVGTAQGLLDIRLHMGRLGKWESPVSTQAKILHRAVEGTLGFFRSTFEDCFKGCFKDCFNDCHHHCVITIGTGSGKVSFNIETSHEGSRASFDEIDAALSMWVFSMEHERVFIDNPENNSNPVDTTQSSHPGTYDSVPNRQCLQILGPATEEMVRDLKLWLPTGEDQTWAATSDEDINHKGTRHVGRSGQWHEKVNLDKKTDRISARSTDTCHQSELDTKTNENGGNTKHKGPWLTVNSQDQPEKFYAKDMFSSFVWALAKHVSQSPNMEQLAVTVQSSNDQDTVKLKNRELSNLVQRIADLGSWTRREVYLCLIPPLSSFGILPGARPVIERALSLGVALEKSQKWDQACDEYVNLRRISEDLPSGSHARWKSLAILARFDARIGKDGTRRFGYQRDDAYESEEVSEVRDRIQDIFMEENKKLENPVQEEACGKQPAVRETLDEALNIYDTFSVTWVTLQRLKLWDSRKEEWRGKIHQDERSLIHKGYIPKRVTSTFDRDIFDRTPFHHAMRSNAPTESQSLPQCDLQRLKEQLKSKTEILSRDTDKQINWSETSFLALLDPAKKCAELMDSTADPKAQDFDHWTPLHYACCIVLPQLSSKENNVPEKEFESVEESLRTIYQRRAVLKAKALIGRKVDVNAQGLDGTTPLHCAASSGCEDLVDLLVKYKANINAQKSDGTTPLHCAMMSGHADVVKYLFRRQAVETIGSDGRTLLHLAAMTNRSTMFSWIKTNSEVKDKAGRTPLHLAAMSGAVASIRELVLLGAKRDVKDHKGRTPLHLACIYNCPDSVKELLGVNSEKERSIYVDPSAKDDHGRTPLHLAALFDSDEAMSALRTTDNPDSALDIDFSAKDAEGRSPIHLAALSNALKALKLLMDPEKGRCDGWPTPDEDNQTPFHLAASKGNQDAIKLMGELMTEKDPETRADILLHKSNADGFTAFSAAAHNGHVSSMQAIIDIEAERDDSHAERDHPHAEKLKKDLLKSKDVDGDTPFMDALRNMNRDVEQALWEMADHKLKDLLGWRQ